MPNTKITKYIKKTTDNSSTIIEQSYHQANKILDNFHNILDQQARNKNTTDTTEPSQNIEGARTEINPPSVSENLLKKIDKFRRSRITSPADINDLIQLIRENQYSININPEEILNELEKIKKFIISIILYKTMADNIEKTKCKQQQKIQNTTNVENKIGEFFVDAIHGIKDFASITKDVISAEIKDLLNLSTKELEEIANKGHAELHNKIPNQYLKDLSDSILEDYQNNHENITPKITKQRTPENQTQNTLLDKNAKSQHIQDLCNKFDLSHQDSRILLTVMIAKVIITMNIHQQQDTQNLSPTLNVASQACTQNTLHNELCNSGVSDKNLQRTQKILQILFSEKHMIKTR